MNYQEAIAVRKRQIAGQPVDRDELAEANRRIAHDREMAGAFGFAQPQSTPPARIGQRNAAPFPTAPQIKPSATPAFMPPTHRTVLHPTTGKLIRCISVDEFCRSPEAARYRSPRA